MKQKQIDLGHRTIHSNEDIQRTLDDLQDMSELTEPGESVTVSVGAAPEWECCDFCSGKPVAFDYPCEDFKTFLGFDPSGSAKFMGSIGHWGACQTCYELVESGSNDSLLNRMLAAHQIPPNSSGVLVTKKQFTGFLEHRKGPAEKTQ